MLPKAQVGFNVEYVNEVWNYRLNIQRSYISSVNVKPFTISLLDSPDVDEKAKAQLYEASEDASPDVNPTHPPWHALIEMKLKCSFTFAWL